MKNKIDNKKVQINGVNFLVKIKFRQHENWKGEIEWMGKKGSVEKCFFHSLLEMIELMQEVLEKEDKS